MAALGARQQSASAPPASETEDVLRVDWSRRSPISTRNALLSVLNRFGHIDEAVVLLCPSLERGLLHELSYETVERAVDSWIKGTLFLLKGVLDLYRNRSAQGQPVLALVDLADQEEGTAFPPLEAALRGSFEATARSLISSYDGESLRVQVFSGFDPQLKGFAEFIVQTLSGRTPRAAGRWHRFPPKSGLLGNLKIPRG